MISQHKGVWLPAAVIHDKNLSGVEKMVFMEIVHLSSLSCGCIASNSHFAKKYNVGEQNISRAIHSLEEKGYIRLEIDARSRYHTRSIEILVEGILENSTARGVWLPLAVIYDKNISMIEKYLLVEIKQLSMLDKGCTASNKHFAALFDIPKESVSRSINSLKEKGYIYSNIAAGSRNFKRVITVNKLLAADAELLSKHDENYPDSKDDQSESSPINKMITTDNKMIKEPSHSVNSLKRIKEYNKTVNIYNADACSNCANCNKL